MCAQIVKSYLSFNDFFMISQVNRGVVGEMEPGCLLDGPVGLIRHQRLQGLAIHVQGFNVRVSTSGAQEELLKSLSFVASRSA